MIFKSNGTAAYQLATVIDDAASGVDLVIRGADLLPSTARQLLHEIQANGRFPLTTNIVKAAINDEFVEWDAPIRDGDQITLLPPFSGG